MSAEGLTSPDAPVVAYALRLPRPECPWLFLYDPVHGLVTAYLSDTVINSRRSHSTKRVHSTLASACNAYALNVRTDLELRWYRGVSPLWIARFEAQRLSARE